MDGADVATPLSRRDERTHLFLVATLYHGRESVPVRVRNLSPRGALIDASALAGVGRDVILRRGKLEVRGTIRWVSRSRAGIAFRSHIFVPEWLPTKSSPLQAAADEMSHSLKSGDLVEVQAPVTVAPDPRSTGAILAELSALKLDLLELGDKLARDIILVATHPEIQTLDLACQRIEKLIDSFGARHLGKKV